MGIDARVFDANMPGKRPTHPTCALCAVPMTQYGFGYSGYAAYVCYGCGDKTKTQDGGKTFTSATEDP